MGPPDRDRRSTTITLNINQSETNLARVDPLKHIFRSVFEVLPPGARGHVVATIGEFLGTLILFILIFGGAQTGSASSNKEQGTDVSTATPLFNPSQLIYVALSVGFAIVVTAWTFFRISGGLFNPVFSLGMALIGAITWFRCLVLCIAQFAATIAASYIAYALFNGGLNVNPGLHGGTSPAQGVVIEMLLTAQVMFTIFMLAAEHHEATFLAPIGIGLSVLVAHLVGFFWTGAGLNPARVLGPCIVNKSFPDFHWIYWVGPITGVILAVIVYKLVKALEYETAHEKDDEEPEQPQPRTEFKGKVRAERKSSSILPTTELPRVATIKAVNEPQKPLPVNAPPTNQAGGDKKWEEKKGEIKEDKKDEQLLPDCYAD